MAVQTGDVAAAEDALGDALYAALCRWPGEGVPRSPEAWLLAVARRRLVDEHRRKEVRRTHEPTLQIEAALRVIEALDELSESDPFPDERLKLLFVCAHPGIDPAARTPLMLQTVLGLDAARIASAFLVAPAAMSQRLVRTKGKIRQSGIAFRVPEPSELPERLEAVLGAVYAAYGLEWGAGEGSDSAQRGMVNEAVSLARVLVELLPGEPEASGLLALMLHCEARRDARRDTCGDYVPLCAQDPRRWSRPMIEEAEGLLRVASKQGKPGRFQWEAAIQSAHAARGLTGAVPWRVIVALYRELLAIAPSVGAQVAHAAALLQAGETLAAGQALDAVPAQTTSAYQPYWAVRAHLLMAVGDAEAARRAFQRAAGLTQDEAVRRFLLRQAVGDPAALPVNQVG